MADRAYVQFSILNFITIGLMVVTTLVILAGVRKFVGKGSAKTAEAK